MGNGNEEATSPGLTDRSEYAEAQSLFRLDGASPLLRSFASFLRTKPDDFDQILSQIIKNEAHQKTRAINPDHAQGIVSEVYVRTMLMRFRGNNKDEDIQIDPIPHKKETERYIFRLKKEGGSEVVDKEKWGKVRYPFSAEYDALFALNGLPVVIEVKSGRHTRGAGGFNAELNPSAIDGKLTPLSIFYNTDTFGYILVGMQDTPMDSGGMNKEKFTQMGGILVALPMTFDELDVYAQELVAQNQRFIELQAKSH